MNINITGLGWASKDFFSVVENDDNHHDYHCISVHILFRRYLGTNMDCLLVLMSRCRVIV